MAERPSAPQPPHAEPDARQGPAAAPHWSTKFLAALADTSNVAAAARTAGIDASTAYNRRRQDHAFNREWQVALCEGYDNLEMELLYRLRTGELKSAAGARRGNRSFDNGTAFRLLAAHRESAARERARRDHVSAEEIRASIDRKVEELKRRVMDAKAQRDTAAEAMAILPKPQDPA
ncbi:MAG: hypothetical protein WCL10_03935 [Novosphingobium sp.]|uniref:hypothetical protein n=1 Tax=Novosphingobium sp. TaxID=1874826 RepID=UPI00301785CD